MRLGIKGKQVLGVTSIVGVVVVVLSVLHLARLASVSLEESRARAELLANAVYQRARDVVSSGGDPYLALQRDSGLRSILESSAYSKHVTFAAIVDVRGIAVADADAAREGRALPGGEDIAALVGRSAVARLAAIYRGPGRTLEWRQPLLLGDTDFGSIRVGISTLLIRDDLNTSLRPSLWTALAALAVAVVGAMLLAQLLLRPIHVIASGLTRLGRGEFGVRLDLDPHDEFGEIGAHFNAVSDQLSADRAGSSSSSAPLDRASQEQAAVRYARKLAALGRLSAGVAHEVKNPLNAMTIHLELLRQQIASALRDTAAAAPALEHANVIGNEIRRLDEVVQGFLKFARPEDLTLERVELAPLLDEMRLVVQPEAERRGVTIAIEGRAGPDVRGDQTLLRQAFLNLALNACQAMPDGGALRIRVEARRDGKVAIAFADNGVGIKPEHLQRIFDLYFTTREKGSGIGLSMVYRTVQMHDGEIEVESTPGVGTTFTVLLPQA
jgi:signal transduction histidine kinase